MPVKDVQALGWTRRSLPLSLLLSMPQPEERPGERVKRLRKSRSWSQEQLAHQAGVSTKTVARLEKQHQASFETIRKIADALKIDRSQLVEQEPGTTVQLDRIEQKLDELRGEIRSLAQIFRPLGAGATQADVDQSVRQFRDWSRSLVDQARRQSGEAAGSHEDTG